MENRELYDLLNRSFHEEISDKDRLDLEHGLSIDQGLKEENGKLTALQSVIVQQPFRFKPFFSARIMNKIEALRENPGIFSGLNYAFMRISLPAMLAICVWVLVFWGAEGSLSVDNFLGVANLSYDELLSDYFVSN